MNDEKLKILEMIAKGKVSPEEGADLLNALENDATISGTARWLFIRVTEPETGKVHVNVRIPVGWASKLLKFVNRFADDVDFDLEELYEAIRAGEPGQVIQVDAEDGNRVEIWLEV